MDQSTQLGGGYCVIYVGVTDTSSYTDEELEDIVIVTEAYVATYFMTNAQLITLQTTTYDLTDSYLIKTTANVNGITRNYAGFEAFDCVIGEQDDADKDADTDDVDTDGNTTELIGGSIIITCDHF